MATVENVSENMDGLDPRNRAEDLVIVDRIRVDVLSKLTGIRGDQAGLRNEWAASFDCWNQTHRVRLYEGASDLFIPVARNIVETFVAQIKSGVFPSVNTLLVEANPMAPGPSPQAIGELLRHCIEQAKVERHLELFIRDALIYGTAIVKFPWVEKTETVYRRRPIVPPELAGMISPELAAMTTVMPEQVRTYYGPAFRPVDIMRFYVYPLTCRDLEDATMIFEDLDASMSHLKAMEAKGIYYDVARVKEQATSSVDPSADGRAGRTNRYGVNIDSGYSVGKFGDCYQLSEIWCIYDLDGTGNDIPCKIVSCGDLVLEARPNPFFHQSPPYLAWKLIDMPDMFFGQGLVSGLKHQNYAVNALTNQGIDAAVFQTAPIVIANANGLTQGMGSIKLGHRSIIYVNGKPSDSIEFVKMPDTSPTAFQTSSLIMQAMRDMAGAPPILQGKLGSNETTATEASILGNNAQSGVDNFIRSLEASVMSPLLQKWYFLLQQFMEEMQYFKIANEPKDVGMSAADLVADVRLRWLVSTQVRDRLSGLQAEMMAQTATTLNQPGVPPMPGATEGPGKNETSAEMGGQPLPGAGR